MRRVFVVAAAVLGLEAEATAQPGYPYQGQGYADPVATVESFYTTYLGRRATEDPTSRFWTVRLQSGISAEAVEAGILGSDEYYKRVGNTPEAWVRAVYRDALRQQATNREVNYWTRRAYSEGLVAVATDILAQRPRANNFQYPGQQVPAQNWGGGQQQVPDYDYRRPYYPYRQ